MFMTTTTLPVSRLLTADQLALFMGLPSTSQRPIWLLRVAIVAMLFGQTMADAM